MIYEVSASYNYLEKGQRYERTISILYRATKDEAVYFGLQWGLNRAQALEWEMPSCIKIHLTEIHRPDKSGYIRSGRGCFHIFEWKYDTSHLSFEALLTHHKKDCYAKKGKRVRRAKDLGRMR